MEQNAGSAADGRQQHRGRQHCGGEGREQGEFHSEHADDRGDAHGTDAAVPHDFKFAFAAAPGEEAVRGVGGAIQVKPFGQRLRKEGEHHRRRERREECGRRECRRIEQDSE